MIPIAAAAALAFGFVPPVAAQQLTEQEARQVAQGIVDAFWKAEQAQDAAAIAALFTTDAIRVFPDGLVLGQAEIEKRSRKSFESFTADADKLDQIKVIGDNAIWVTGTWSGTWAGPNGPIRLSGRWVSDYVREGGAWKIRANTFNVTPKE
jgi:uncharacterized protein (TIGR02246 family)